MTRLSVNINKIATLRNARGGNIPNVCQVAKDCEKFGADGITIHPRPDERHITKKDAYDLKKIVTTEFNIEGNPNDRFMKLIKEIRPTQATLVPDSPNVLTSNAGWDTIKYKKELTEICKQIARWGVRTSIFVDTELKNIEGAKAVGTDRIELYTESYASQFKNDKEKAIEAYIKAAEKANELGLKLNAGHDLDLENLAFFSASIPKLKEVSIGHALISDALYYGLENTIRKYKDLLR